ncbi:MAG: DUF1330 domain-containing protein [Parvibaculum sp.]|jgi:uncharacterized protein (DUF1330 family)|nr:DUF1330 domain-containing protein [Parvibaculum sp.]|tara:strand:+ start:4884 stop:5297 length:414 start_codon:yes stop_codon:yes gene_type:complete
MDVVNAMRPNEAQIKEWTSGSVDGPIVMVNLLKFYDKAQYPDGRDPDISGAEAYQRYGAEVSKLVEGLGGKMIYGGAVTLTLIGEVAEDWDVIACVQYPSRKAMLEMTMSDDYRAIEVHRDAGLAGQLNIETVSGFM